MYLVQRYRVLLGFNVVSDFKSKPRISYCFKNLRALMNNAKSTQSVFYKWNKKWTEMVGT